MKAEFAIIGGTGVYDPKSLEQPKQHIVETAYGNAQVTIGSFAGKTIAFLPRHGYGHSVPPHKINYMANMMALKQLGATQVFATAAVGSLREYMPPGSFVIVDQFLDFTKSRPVTYYDGSHPSGIVHVDMTEPYCRRLSEALAQASSANNIAVVKGGVYVCTEGPRFETPAEIRMFRQLGGDIVGMTSVPEVVLAKELGLCYATVAMVTNLAAGISQTPLTHEEVVTTMGKNVARIRELFFATIERLSDERDCRCPRSVEDLGAL